MSTIKENIARNIYRLRTKNNMTQPELASILNYTDKSVSKWENGISTPPIDVLKDIADTFGVSIDYLVSSEADDTYDNIYDLKENNPNKIIITSLSFSLVWLITVMLYAYGLILANHSFWQFFVYAIPVSSIVLIVFNAIWGRRLFTYILVSILAWSILLSVYILFIENSPWAIFLIGIPFQISIILWSQLKSNKKKIPKNK